MTHPSIDRAGIYRPFIALAFALSRKREEDAQGKGPLVRTLPTSKDTYRCHLSGTTARPSSLRPSMPLFTRLAGVFWFACRMSLR